MKKLVLIIAILSVLCASGAYAQKQSGVVKTRGKMVNGKLVPGTMLSGATVQVEGRQAILAKDGKFSFPVKDGKFTLKSVSKQGYQLIDAEACRQYQYSKNPLTIVMEQPDQLRSDQLATERKLRRELQRRIQQREDEIDALNASVEEKNRLLVQLNKEREENEKIIETMAKYYATLDYDQLDAFQRQVSQLLENGSLERADSLLRTRGGMDSRIARIHQEQKALTEAQAAQSMRQKRLDESKAGTRKKLEAIATDCYSFYQRFFMAHQNDSAAYYLELRAGLDTTNAQWQLEAGLFMEDYIVDMEMAKTYYLRAKRLSIDIDDGINYNLSRAYSGLGGVCKKKGQYPEMMSNFQKSLEIRKALYGERDSRVCGAYINIATANYYIGNYDLALLQFDSILTILKESGNEISGASATAYGNMAAIYTYYKGDYAKALQLLKKEEEIMIKVFGDDLPDLISTYMSISETLMNNGELDEAMDYNKKAYDLSMEHFGADHPSTADVVGSRGICHLYKGEFDEALPDFAYCYEKKCKFLGEDSEEAAAALLYIGYVHLYKGDFEKAVEMGNKILATHLKIVGEKHKSTAYDYLFLANCYEGMNDFDKALKYAEKSLEIYKQTLGEENEETQAAKGAIEEIKEKRRESGVRDNGEKQKK